MFHQMSEVEIPAQYMETFGLVGESVSTDFHELRRGIHPPPITSQNFDTNPTRPKTSATCSRLLP